MQPQFLPWVQRGVFRGQRTLHKDQRPDSLGVRRCKQRRNRGPHRMANHEDALAVHRVQASDLIHQIRQWGVDGKALRARRYQQRRES